MLQEQFQRARESADKGARASTFGETSQKFSVHENSPAIAGLIRLESGDGSGCINSVELQLG
jgi:hypothetical protein